MDRAEALRRVTEARVGRLATTRPDGRPHLVPVTFAVLGSILVHMIDHKPKTTDRLQRLANLDSDGRASLLVDHYEDSWDRLWWVRVDGHATVVSNGPEWESARAALSEKYSQYEDRPPQGAAILLTIKRLSYWESTP